MTVQIVAWVQDDGSTSYQWVDGTFTDRDVAVATAAQSFAVWVQADAVVVADSAVLTGPVPDPQIAPPAQTDQPVVSTPDQTSGTDGPN